MTRARSYRTEYLLLGLIALLLGALLLIPWKSFADLNGRTQNGKYAVLKLRAAPPPGRHIVLWKAALDYSPAEGTLEVRLDNHYDEPPDGLWLHADFTARGSRAPATGAAFTAGPDGAFRAGDVRLAPGEWIVGLTATGDSGLVFRLEQPLKVE